MHRYCEHWYLHIILVYYSLINASFVCFYSCAIYDDDEVDAGKLVKPVLQLSARCYVSRTGGKMIRQPTSSAPATAAAADTTFVNVDAARTGCSLGRRHLPQAVEQRQSKSMFSLPAPSSNPYSQFNGLDVLADVGG